jgi:hypothetical protein
MLKKIVLEGVRIGVIVGCITAVLYAWPAALIFLLFRALDFSILDVFLLGLLLGVLFLIPAALIGTIAGSVFGLLFQKLCDRKNLYIAACVCFCVITFTGAFSIFLIMFWENLFPVAKNSLYYAQGSLSLTYGLLVSLGVVPGILYCVMSYPMSRYVFGKFQQIKLEHQLSTPASD